MTKHFATFLIPIAFLTINLITDASFGDDWAQWRGANRAGEWAERGIVDQLTKDKLKVLWRKPIGGGYCGPTVADGRVFVMDRNDKSPNVPSGQVESIRCFDSKSGEQIWQVEYEAVYKVSYPAGPRASVTIDNGLAFAVGTMGHFHCLDVADGNVKWKLDLNDEYRISASKRMPIWGISCSPIVHGNLVILQLGGPDGAGVVAFEKATGNEAWRSLEDRGQYSSPVMATQNGKEVLVCWTGDSIAGLNPETGKAYWRHPFKPSRMPIGVATPIIKDDMIFVTSFYDGSMMVRMKKDSMDVEQVWAAKGENEKVTQALHSIISTPIWIDDHIYGVDSYGELRCLRASDGERVWEELGAVKRNRWGTIHFVSNRGKVWMFNEQGEMIVARLSDKGLDEKSRVKIIEPTQPQLQRRGGVGVCWSHPAFANRCIFVRNDEEIVCIDVSK